MVFGLGMELESAWASTRLKSYWFIFIQCTVSGQWRGLSARQFVVEALRTGYSQRSVIPLEPGSEGPPIQFHFIPLPNVIYARNQSSS